MRRLSSTRIIEFRGFLKSILNQISWNFTHIFFYSCRDHPESFWDEANEFIEGNIFIYLLLYVKGCNFWNIY